tara:strand:- start:448 stop:633 length:186 start_codon:yes stop_codon:yes gene_type:complete
MTVQINLTDRQADLLFHMLDIHEASSSNQADRDLACEVRRQIEEAEEWKREEAEQRKGGDS